MGRTNPINYKSLAPCQCILNQNRSMYDSSQSSRAVLRVARCVSTPLVQLTAGGIWHNQGMIITSYPYLPSNQKTSHTRDKDDVVSHSDTENSHKSLPPVRLVSSNPEASPTERTQTTKEFRATKLDHLPVSSFSIFLYNPWH